MDLNEYNKVKNMNYNQYCNYLLNKYGSCKVDYMDKNYCKNRGVSRTQEGLFAHHIKEDTCILLSTPEWAKKAPYEYQHKENIVYCDWLEHLFLHILISCDKNSLNKKDMVGIGGVKNFLVPQLDEMYSGKYPTAKWEQNCFNQVIFDEDVFDILIERFNRDNVYNSFVMRFSKVLEMFKKSQNSIDF